MGNLLPNTTSNVLPMDGATKPRLHDNTNIAKIMIEKSNLQ